jgi:hypothetical protein
MKADDSQRSAGAGNAPDKPAYGSVSLMYRPIHIAAIALLSFTVGCVLAASLLLVGGLPFQAGARGPRPANHSRSIGPRT